MAYSSFAWADPALQEDLHRMARQPMPRGQGTQTYRRVPSYLDRPMVRTKRHILFVSYYPSVNILKKSIALRETGKYFTTFVGCCIREDVEIERWVDQSFEVESFMDFYPLLRKAAPFAAHVQSPHPLCAAVALDSLPPSTPVVLDLYDSQHIIHRDPEAFSRRLERAMLRRADAFCHKMPPPAVKEIRADCGVICPDEEVQSLPYRAFFRTPSQRGANPETPRLVYAGGIMPRHIALREGHANQIFDPFISAVLNQKLDFEMFANCNARDMFFEEHQHYLDMARQPGFRFRPGVPFFRLASVLSGAHYGVLYDNLPLSSYRNEAFTWNYSTKIYSYMEAGLPILLMDDFTAMADLIMRHGLGITYSGRNVEAVASLLAAAPWTELVEHVISFREEHELSSIVPRLQRLYETVQKDSIFVQR